MGVSQTTAAEIMPDALRGFRDEHPEVEVVLSEIGDAAAADALANRSLDLAFAVNPGSDDRIETVPVLDDPWVILTRRDSEIADLVRPGFDVLNGLDVVAWTHRWKAPCESLSSRAVVLYPRSRHLTAAARALIAAIRAQEAA